ncbi:MAG: hypothetical protein GY943_11615 [Chloroflexi bacterium]|nr:hypothetical protein [Chloroflexota bacterium]
MFALIVKLLIVIAFLIYFLRRPSILAAIGLITVTTAVLLDTFLGTFNREQMLGELGFFFYVIAGLLVGGMAIWIAGVLRPYLGNQPAATSVIPTFAPKPQPQPIEKRPSPAASGTAFDRQMLFDEIRARLGRDDVLDLLFDLSINENDVMTLQQDLNQLIVNMMDIADQQGQTGALALAVERILTPPPPENLPRLEKIDTTSPPTILRHYLLAHFNFGELKRMATRLNIDWEQLDGANKKSFVRNFLQHLYRRNNLDRLIALMNEDSAPESSNETPSPT